VTRSADYPGAIWSPAHSSNYRAADRPVNHEFDIVIIHCSDGRAFANRIAEMWREPDHKSSAHFVIGQDGTVIQCVALADVAWHAHAANACSVGIEHCARTPKELGPDDPGLPPSDALYEASARLTAWLIKRVNLTGPVRNHVLGHSEADHTTSHDRCPSGCGWDWPRYIALVEAELEDEPQAA
jgi:N-acetyl-anhydromuramyl-L-alanine amidase AmpD